MSLIGVVLVLIVIGVLLWLLNNKIPMIDANMKLLINIVVFICVVIWLLKVFGLMGTMNAVTIPRAG